MDLGFHGLSEILDKINLIANSIFEGCLSTDPVKQCHDGNGRSNTGAGGQEVQQQSQVSVVVVDGVVDVVVDEIDVAQFSEQN